MVTFRDIDVSELRKWAVDLTETYGVAGPKLPRLVIEADDAEVSNAVAIAVDGEGTVLDERFYEGGID